MKIKIVGFKVGKARPTFNRTIDGKLDGPSELAAQVINEKFISETGRAVLKALSKSDYLSIRWVE